jgi:hypothetical protein
MKGENKMTTLSNEAKTKLEELAGMLKLGIKTGTPVNSVCAFKILNVTGVVVHGETVTINNPAVPGTDVYKFVGDGIGDISFIPVDISEVTTHSTGILTVDTQPTSGDTITIGSKVYTFVPVGTDTADGEISIGASLELAQAAIIAAINGTDGVNDPHPLVSIEPFNANAATITALIGGTCGDDIATTETFTAVTNIFAGVKLSGGVDCSAENAINALEDAILANDSQGIVAEDSNADTTVLYAKVSGAAGNSIIIGETMVNGAFNAGATTLSGGVDGTIGYKGQQMMDTGYLYTCLDTNDITGRNWRRISLGTIY